MHARSATTAATAVATLLVALVAGPALAGGTGGTGGTDSVTMCHRTRSVTNPYRQITVSQASVTGNNGAGGGNGSGHGGHTGVVFNPAEGYYSTHAKDWGDVIPPFGNYKGLNSTGALPAAPTCRAMAAGEFYNLQREAGVSRDLVIADLQEQGAAGDPPATELAALVYTGADVSLRAADEAATGGQAPQPDPVGPGPVVDPQPEPVDPGPVVDPQPEPVDPGPVVDPQPVPDPVDPGPVVDPGPDPVDPGPVVAPQPDPGPVDPGPVDPGPADPGPGPGPVAGPGPGGTTPPPTTVPATPVTTGSQRITGVVWLDRNRDGVQSGPAEPGLPAVAVELTRVDLGGAGGGTGRAGARVAAAGEVAVARVRTSADGVFEFTGLAPGAYAIRVQYPPELAVTWDSEGAADASARVVVPESGEAQAQVGLAGEAVADLEVRTARGGPVDGTVRLWWSGPDGVFGTDDDLLIPALAVAGRVHVEGLPAGSYRVLAPDGTVSPGIVTLDGSGRRTTVVLGAAATGPELAATGSPAAAVLAAAGYLVVAGVALARIGGRRTSRR